MTRQRHVSPLWGLRARRVDSTSASCAQRSRAPLSALERSRKGQRRSRKGLATSGVPEPAERARGTRWQSEARWQTRAARALERGPEKARRKLEIAVKGFSGVRRARGSRERNEARWIMGADSRFIARRCRHADAR